MAKIIRKTLLTSPVRDWADTSPHYDCLYLVPTGKKHESGYMSLALVGASLDAQGSGMDFQVAAYCDDVNWHIPPKSHHYRANLRMDCEYPSGIVRAHLGDQRGGFRVGRSLSSTSVWVGTEEE